MIRDRAPCRAARSSACNSRGAGRNPPAPRRESGPYSPDSAAWRGSSCGSVRGRRRCFRGTKRESRGSRTAKRCTGDDPRWNWSHRGGRRRHPLAESLLVLVSNKSKEHTFESQRGVIGAQLHCLLVARIEERRRLPRVTTLPVRIERKNDNSAIVTRIEHFCLHSLPV